MFCIVFNISKLTASSALGTRVRTLGKSTGAFQRRVVTRREKEKLANQICATSPYWADELLGANVMKVISSMVLGRQ
jgi:hypothetical protein